MSYMEYIGTILGVAGIAIVGWGVLWIIGRMLFGGGSESLAPRKNVGESTSARDRDAARQVYEGNEQVHQGNLADMNRIASRLQRRQRPALDYGPRYPQLTDGDVIEGEVTDISGLLGKGER